MVSQGRSQGQLNFFPIFPELIRHGYVYSLLTGRAKHGKEAESLQQKSPSRHVKTIQRLLVFTNRDVEGAYWLLIVRGRLKVRHAQFLAHGSINPRAAGARKSRSEPLAPTSDGGVSGLTASPFAKPPGTRLCDLLMRRKALYSLDYRINVRQIYGPSQ